MAEKKRQCGTCRFFAKTESNGHGKCTHPKRDKAIREMVLLRPNELGCRTRWGTSLWQDPADESDPTAPETPQQPTLPDPIAAQLHYDDEVTSVSIAGSTSTRTSFDDDVVDSGAVAPRLGSWSDSVQEERRRLLMNGNQEALAGARKRHIEKQTRLRELVPFADDETESNDTSEAGDTRSDSSQSAAAPHPPFQPDDYVETERSTQSDAPVIDDELLDEGAGADKSRSPRVNKLLRDSKSPKNHKAMGLGVPSEMAVTSNNPERREKWNSVPSMTSGFDLPFMSADTARLTTSVRMTASAAPMMTKPAPTRTVSQARELKSEDRLRQERARRQFDVPMAIDKSQMKADIEKAAAVTLRPRLTQAPPPQAAPVERLKASPLRGTHPTVKLATARARENEAVRPAQMQTAPSRPTISNPRPERAPHQEARTEQINTAKTEQRQPQREQQIPAQRQKPRVEPDTPRPYIPVHQVKEATPFARVEIEIAPHVPARCGTCTSFRPSDVKGRGSCANEFAGPVQRVVNEQDLACEHTFGSFWLPADERVWLKELKDHRQPTPRVDRMIARRSKEKTVVLPDLEDLTS